jgi:4-diphosphocytidyl-2-C-methyl-D-erythritol kinase
MSPIEPPLPSGTKVCIVKPSIGLSTPSVFKALEYDRLSVMDPDKILLPTFLKGIDHIPKDLMVNDLEYPAFKCLPELKKLKEELVAVAGFDHVMMSGSGTSIFCLGSPTDLDSFNKKFTQRDDLLVFFTQFINRPHDTWYEKP